MFEPRTYRQKMETGRFKTFPVSYFETDLWIGVKSKSDHPKIKDFALKKVIELRSILENYISINPDFGKTLSPLSVDLKAPLFIQEMMVAAEKANVGPMAAVAGIFSEYIGKELELNFEIDEIIVENGGDIYLNIKEPITISIFAGKSVLSEKVGIKILPEFAPLGVCTSSGTIGHSFSFGKADAVMIVCKNTALADAYATSFCNLIKKEEDIESIINKISKSSDILSAAIILNDKLGITGKFKLEIIK